MLNSTARSTSILLYRTPDTITENAVTLALNSPTRHNKQVFSGTNHFNPSKSIVQHKTHTIITIKKCFPGGSKTSTHHNSGVFRHKTHRSNHHNNGCFLAENNHEVYPDGILHTSPQSWESNTPAIHEVINNPVLSGTHISAWSQIINRYKFLTLNDPKRSQYLPHSIVQYNV